MAACFHIILPSKRTKCSLRQPNFQNFPGHPLEARASGSRLVLLLVGPHPPAKEPAYGPEINAFFQSLGTSLYRGSTAVKHSSLNRDYKALRVALHLSSEWEMPIVQIVFTVHYLFLRRKLGPLPDLIKRKMKKIKKAMSPRNASSKRCYSVLRRVPTNTKLFCEVYEYEGKADLSKGYWDPKRKLGQLCIFQR